MNVDPIKRFLSRAKSAVASRSKEVRLPTDEANELAIAIGELMAAALANSPDAPPTELKIRMDGGSLK